MALFCTTRDPSNPDTRQSAGPLSQIARSVLHARRVPRWLGVLLGILLLAGQLHPVQAQFRDIGYTFEPTASGFLESDNAAIQNGVLYGGALGLNFGRYLQLNGEYLVNTGLSSRFANIDELNGLLNRNLDARRYGGRLRLNLYDRRIIPYLTVGTGALEFNPDNVESSRTIYAVGGGGITFSVRDRYRLSVGAEMLTYRYDPVATFLGPLAQDFEGGQRLVRSPALHASLALFLGGRSLEEQTAVDEAMREQFGQGGFFQGINLFVNPFYGRIEFNEALGFPRDQNMAGVNAGVELGPYVGLRGFYWRAMEGNDVFDEFGSGFQDLQMYGGELRLRLNAQLGRGFVPYGLLGGGYLDVLSNYGNDLPEGATVPSDRFFATVGGGLEVPVIRSIKLSGGVRSLLMNNVNGEVGNNPSEVFGSLMYNAGIEFRLGGGDAPRRPQPRPEPLLARPQPDTAQAPDAPTEPTQQGEAAQEDAFTPRTAAQAQLMAQIDSLRQEVEALRDDRASRDTPETAPEVAASSRSNVSDQRINIPVPEVGEIYIRFGDGAAPAQTQRDTAVAAQQGSSGGRPEQVEQLVRQALQEQLAQSTQADSAADLSEEAIDRIVQRTLRSVAQRGDAPDTQAMDLQQRTAQQQAINRLEEQIADLQRTVREQYADINQARREAADRPAPAAAEGTSDADPQPFYRSVLGRPLTYAVPVTGLRAGEGPEQWVLGIRGDYRTSSESRLHILPELSVGLGGGTTSFSILANGAVSFLRDRTPQLTGLPLEPYAGAGVGIASERGVRFQPVTNLMLGTSYRFSNGQTAFVEYSAIDLFRLNRLTFGYRIHL